MLRVLLKVLLTFSNVTRTEIFRAAPFSMLQIRLSDLDDIGSTNPSRSQKVVTDDRLTIWVGRFNLVAHFCEDVSRANLPSVAFPRSQLFY